MSQGIKGRGEMKTIIALVVVAVLSVALNRVTALRMTVRMSSVVDRPKSYSISSSFANSKIKQDGAAPVAATPPATVLTPKAAADPASNQAPRSYGIGLRPYWKGMTEEVEAPTTAEIGSPAAVAAVSVGAPVAAAAPVVIKAPRSYSINKTPYWKSETAAPVVERVVPEAVVAKKEPLKSVVKQTPVTPAPTGATPPRSYGISKQYWKTQLVAEAVPADVEKATSTSASTSTSTSTSADAAIPRRSYGISKPYWKKSSSGIDAKATLQVLLSSRSTSEKKEEAFAPLRRLRQENIQEYELVIDEIFALIDSIEGNKWCKRRLPIALPSFRTKLGSLKRTLDSTTADQSKNGRKRGLLIALGALVKQSGGVRALEKAAMKGKKEVTMTEMLARTPDNLETPRYAVVDQVPAEVSARAWEVRKYDDFTVCSIETEMGTEGGKGSRKGPAGFNTLAGYIFGKNKEATKMSMTTPVLTTEDRMYFVMPPDFWDAAKLSQAPTPMDESITLEKPLTTSQTLAVMWFSGYALAATAEEKKDELLALVEASDVWKAAEGAQRPYLMQYNDPFVVPWKRRNEVAVPVVPM